MKGEKSVLLYGVRAENYNLPPFEKGNILIDGAKRHAALNVVMLTNKKREKKKKDARSIEYIFEAFYPPAKKNEKKDRVLSYFSNRQRFFFPSLPSRLWQNSNNVT